MRPSPLCGDGRSRPSPNKGTTMSLNKPSTLLATVAIPLTEHLFQKDTGTKSVCSGECAIDWPPVRAKGEPTVGDGANASLVATTKRADGAPQVTYNGHPLYLYEGDQEPGDTTGHGVVAFGAAWYGLTPAGDQVSGGTSASGGTSGN